MLKAMSMMNPCLSEIIHKIIPSITNRTITAQSDVKLEPATEEEDPLQLDIKPDLSNIKIEVDPE